MKRWYFIPILIVAIALPCFAGWYTCKRCHGTGVMGTKDCSRCNGKREIVTTCNYCNGSGKVRDSYGDLQNCPTCNGWGKEIVTCPSCGGSGEEPWVCNVCNGTGQVYIEE